MLQFPKRRRYTPKNSSKRLGASLISTTPASTRSASSAAATSIKTLDLGDWATMIFSYIPTYAPILPPLKGTSFFNRLGNRTRGQSLRIRGYVQTTGANALEVYEQLGRIIVYYDRQPNGSPPAGADLLADYDQLGTATVTAASNINPTNRERFVILRDRQLYFPPVGASGTPALNTGGEVTDTSAVGFNFNEFIDLGGLESFYNNDNTGFVSDITTGAYGIFVISTDATGNPAWEFSFDYRFSFYD